MQKSSYTVGIIGTMLIHLMVLVLFLEFSSNAPNQSHPAPAASDNPPVEVVLLTEVDTSAGDLSVDPLYTADGKECPAGAKTYLGIGIVYEVSTGEIYQAPPTLPAYQAGIRIGDLLLNNPVPDANEMMYPKILRGHTQLTFSVKTTQICYSTEPLTSS